MDVDRKTNKETNAAPNTENTYDIHDIQKSKACVIRLSIWRMGPFALPRFR